MRRFAREPSPGERSEWIDAAHRCEWLETDGLGGFASGTVSGARTRRYHALLLAAMTPPAGRFVLVNGFDAQIASKEGVFPISTQRYGDGLLHPDGTRRLRSFTTEPWPTWRFRLEDGTVVVQETFVPARTRAAVVRWRYEGPPRADLRLSVRPFFSGRDAHALHRENGAFRFDPEARSGSWIFRPYDGVPAVLVLANGSYAHAPEWYRRFQYEEERRRGFDFMEDLASPGLFSWSLGMEEAVWILAASGEEGKGFPLDRDEEAGPLAGRLAAREAARRASFPTFLHRAADAYVVDRGDGRTIVAGYPWFTDWGRDTFIALHGLCLAGGRMADARAILLEWTRHVSEGMLPNRFPDGDAGPEWNSVDASLWFIVAVHEYLREIAAVEAPPAPAERRAGTGSPSGAAAQEDRLRLEAAVDAILEGYARGTRFGIRADGDGLLAAGVEGIALTWMDARVDGRPITPRIGKPVEVQALWLNALAIASVRSQRWSALHAAGLASFRERFWNSSKGCLYDVVDADHRPGAVDASLRPNQILAVGGLPFALVQGEQARRIVDVVESKLLTDIGLRSLAPDEPGYRGRYEGGPAERDGAYHQGTVWPWLMGPFVDAWVRVRGGGAEVAREAAERFVAPLLGHLEDGGLGHLTEIADGEPPHRPRGCPFQAWSLGALMGLLREHEDVGPVTDGEVDT